MHRDRGPMGRRQHHGRGGWRRWIWFVAASVTLALLPLAFLYFSSNIGDVSSSHQTPVSPFKPRTKQPSSTPGPAPSPSPSRSPSSSSYPSLSSLPSPTASPSRQTQTAPEQDVEQHRCNCPSPVPVPSPSQCPSVVAYPKQNIESITNNEDMKNKTETIAAEPWSKENAYHYDFSGATFTYSVMLTSSGWLTAEYYVKQQVASLVGVNVVRRVAYIDEAKHESVGLDIKIAINRLIKEGVLTEVVYLDYSVDTIRSTFQKVYGVATTKKIENWLDRHGKSLVTNGKVQYGGWKAYYAYLWTLVDCNTSFCVHFDADMAIYFNPNSTFSWAQEAARILALYDDMYFAGPKSGYPEPDFIVKPANQKLSQFGLDPRGFWAFSTMTTRVCMFMKSKIDAAVPFDVPNYESHHVEDALSFTLSKRFAHFRAALMSDQAWTVHTPGSGEDKLNVIECVKRGLAPEGQEGKYDAMSSGFWARECREFWRDTERERNEERAKERQRAMSER